MGGLAAEISLLEILAALGGLAGLAALINSFNKASTSRVENLVHIIDKQDAHITYLRAELAAVRLELTKATQRYNDLVRCGAEGLELPEDTAGE